MLPALTLNQAYYQAADLNIYALTRAERARCFMRAEALNWKLLRHCQTPLRALTLNSAIKWRNASQPI